MHMTRSLDGVRSWCRSAGVTAAALLLLALPAGAQWRNIPMDGVPLGADGKPNMSAPAPRTGDGKPELFEFICNVNEKSTQHMGPHIK